MLETITNILNSHKVYEKIGISSQSVIDLKTELATAIFNALVIPVDNENFPDHEVIAIGYQNEAIVGYMGITLEGKLICEDDHQILEHLTHYMEIPKIEKP